MCGNILLKLGEVCLLLDSQPTKTSNSRLDLLELIDLGVKSIYL